DRMAGRAEARAFQHRAVRQDQERRRAGIGPGWLFVGHGESKPDACAPVSWAGKAIAVLRDEINSELKEAMKSGDKRRVSTLRMMNAAIKNGDIEARGQGKEALGDDAIASLLQKMIKQRQEAAELYDRGGRAELALGEREEIDIIT